ncbi:MAG: hypothetical protein HYR88_14710 [Verrucomicrobia bacterium]|nr:hypothetical protein [Verrucomicrobiota bacterium]
MKSDRKLPKRFDRSLFIFEWERGWIQEVRLDSFGQLESIHRFLPHMTFKRPISMAFGPDGAMYLIEWGSAWYDNKDAQLVRIESVPLVPL